MSQPLDSRRYKLLHVGLCEFGRKCDARLEELGARRVYPRTDCDVEYDEAAAAWTAGVFPALSQSAGRNGRAAAPAAPAAGPVEELGYSRKRPFPARMLTNRLLNRTGSQKEVRHFEMSLEGSGLIERDGHVTIASRRGAMRARAFVTPTIRAGQVFVPMHYDEVNRLTFPAFDPHSRQPGYKACAVSVTAAS